MSGGEYGAYEAYKGWNKEGHGSHLLVIFKVYKAFWLVE